MPRRLIARPPASMPLPKLAAPICLPVAEASPQVQPSPRKSTYPLAHPAARFTERPTPPLPPANPTPTPPPPSTPNPPEPPPAWPASSPFRPIPPRQNRTSKFPKEISPRTPPRAQRALPRVCPAAPATLTPVRTAVAEPPLPQPAPTTARVRAVATVTAGRQESASPPVNPALLLRSAARPAQIRR